MEKKKEKPEMNTSIPVEPKDRIKQTSSYKGNKCEPDNNLFFEELSNPLCSKGN